MDNSLKIFINYYDILKKVFFLGFVSVTLLFCILNIKSIFADENTEKTIFLAYDFPIELKISNLVYTL